MLVEAVSLGVAVPGFSVICSEVFLEVLAIKFSCYKPKQERRRKIMNLIKPFPYNIAIGSQDNLYTLEYLHKLHTHHLPYPRILRPQHRNALKRFIQGLLCPYRLRCALLFVLLPH